MKESKKNIAFIALGSNLGEREANFAAAIAKFNENQETQVVKASKWLENPAIDEAGPHDFLNGVIKLETNLDAFELFALSQKIEIEIDPKREQRGRKKARLIDIDILTFNNEKIQSDELVLPHPRMHLRSFVMKPLMEIEASDMAEEIIKRSEFKASKNTIHVPHSYTVTGKENENLKKQASSLARSVLNSFDKFKIRKMYLDDIDQVHALDQKVFGPKHWSRNVFSKELSNNFTDYLIAEDSKEFRKIIGYAGAWFVLDEVHIMTLGIEPEFRRNKIAEAFICAIIATALQNDSRSISLEVRASNEAAKKLYNKFAFQSLGMRKGYYDNPKEDALLLWTENIQETEFLENYIKRLEALQAKFQAPNSTH